MKSLILECRSWDTCPNFGIRREINYVAVSEGVVTQPRPLCSECLMDMMIVERVAV